MTIIHFSPKKPNPEFTPHFVNGGNVRRWFRDKTFTKNFKHNKALINDNNTIPFFQSVTFSKVDLEIKLNINNTRKDSIILVPLICYKKTNTEPIMTLVAFEEIDQGEWKFPGGENLIVSTDFKFHASDLKFSGSDLKEYSKPNKPNFSAKYEIPKFSNQFLKDKIFKKQNNFFQTDNLFSLCLYKKNDLKTLLTSNCHYISLHPFAIKCEVEENGTKSNNSYITLIAIALDENHKVLSTQPNNNIIFSGSNWDPYWIKWIPLPR